MAKSSNSSAALLGAILLLSAHPLQAQAQQGQQPPVSNDAPQAGLTPTARGGNNNFGGGGTGTFPSRTPGDKVALARGKKAYETNCQYCHGEDARGGDNGGSNIIRSDYLMKDQGGDVLRAFLLNTSGAGHSGVREGTLKFDFSKNQPDVTARYARLGLHADAAAIRRGIQRQNAQAGLPGDAQRL